MTIWVGYDGTLNDDEGDGPAAGHLVGQDDGDFGSSITDALGTTTPADSGGGGLLGGLSDFGSSLGSAFGSSSTPGGAGGAGGGLGGIGGDLSNLFSGKGDTGSALGDVFGKLAKTALPAVTQAAEGGLSKAFQRSSPSPQQQQRSSPSPQQQTSSPSLPQQQTSSQHPASPGGNGGARKLGGGANPKARLNLFLAHLAKKYGMPAPGGAGHFVSKMMGGPASHA